MLSSPRGAVVGICQLVAVLPPGNDRKLPSDQRIWSDRQQYRFLLTDVRKFLAPIPYRGMPRFFEVMPPALVADAIATAIPATASSQDSYLPRS
jgi:hypothetical protein